MRRVFATDFAIFPMARHLERASDAMVAAPNYWERLANYILLYDQIVIPTGNLQVVPVLRLMLGDPVLDELLRTNTIVFARFDRWFGYGGNGAGLVFFQVIDGPDHHPTIPNLATSFFKPLDQAVSTVLRATNPPSTPERRSQLTTLLTENVVQLPTETITSGLREEVHQDVLGSPYLRDFLAMRNSGRPLNALAGIRPRELQFFSPHVPPEPRTNMEVRAVLRVAFENFLLSLASHTATTDIVGNRDTLSILRAKGQRLGYAPEGDGAFTRLQEITGVPNLGRAFAAKQLSPERLLEMRRSPHSQALRDWFAAGGPGESAEDTVRRYVDSIGRPSWLESLPAKVIRFAMTTGIGALNPIAGATASGVDSFLLSKWFPSRSPRLFLRHAKSVVASNPSVRPPAERQMGRNEPCRCGSGKKFKKCCGP